MKTEYPIPTHKEAIGIYTLLIEDIKQYLHSPVNFWLCNRIQYQYCKYLNIDTDVTRNYIPYEILFPEFYKHKPEGKDIGDGWFTDNHKRLEVLNQCLAVREKMPRFPVCCGFRLDS